MKILYIGSFFENSTEKEIWENSKGVMVICGDTFQKALLDGFNNINEGISEIVNLPAIGSFPLRYKKMWIKSSKFKYGKIPGINGGFLNFTVIKYLGIYLSLKKHAMKWAKVNLNEDRVIIVYSLVDSYLRAAIAVKKKYPNVRICCIVLDLPQYFNDKKSLVYTILSKYSTYATSYLIPRIDSFVLLTEPMVDVLGIESKPWLLMEGIYSPKNRFELTKEKKTILYTGKLDSRFGILDMIEAFKQIEDKEYKLWICGDGTERQLVEQATKYDSRIRYFGLIRQEKVFAMQQQATLLLNPRKGDEEYTKYSFPSKTMEYMASGTPTVMYSLLGMPREYEQYLIIIPDNSVETLRNVLVDWCEKTHEELNQFGERAKQFILNEKHSISQANRMFLFLKGENYE